MCVGLYKTHSKLSAPGRLPESPSEKPRPHAHLENWMFSSTFQLLLQCRFYSCCLWLVGLFFFLYKAYKERDSPYKAVNNQNPSKLENSQNLRICLPTVTNQIYKILLLMTTFIRENSLAGIVYYRQEKIIESTEILFFWAKPPSSGL